VTSIDNIFSPPVRLPQPFVIFSFPSHDATALLSRAFAFLRCHRLPHCSIEHAHLYHCAASETTAENSESCRGPTHWHRTGTIEEYSHSNIRTEQPQHRRMNGTGTKGGTSADEDHPTPARSATPILHHYSTTKMSTRYVWALARCAQRQQRRAAPLRAAAAPLRRRCGRQRSRLPAVAVR
jgi:hypothetical protein